MLDFEALGPMYDYPVCFGVKDSGIFQENNL